MDSHAIFIELVAKDVVDMPYTLFVFSIYFPLPQFEHVINLCLAHFCKHGPLAQSPRSLDILFLSHSCELIDPSLNNSGTDRALCLAFPLSSLQMKLFGSPHSPMTQTPLPPRSDWGREVCSCARLWVMDRRLGA